MIKDLLTPKEKEVLQYINDVNNLQDLADKLYISINTLKTHLNNIRSKFHVTSKSGCSTFSMLRIYQIAVKQGYIKRFE